MQTLEMLLGIDQEKLNKRPSKKLFMPRLSELSGNKVYFTVRAFTLDEAKEIKENATKTDHTTNEDYYDEQEGAIFTILNGVVEPNLKDSQLREKFGAPTPVELIKKLLLPGEISAINAEIMKLSGFSSGVVVDGEDVKN